jgi:hypothetical protein
MNKKGVNIFSIILCIIFIFKGVDFMKKSICFLILFVFSSFFIFNYNLFGDEVKLGRGYYKYVNNDGSLDWDTFYNQWDQVPSSYFIYINYSAFKDVDPSRNSLWKAVGGGIYGLLDPTRKNDIIFTLECPGSKLEIIFSPFYYINEDSTWIRVGEKRNNYNEAIERWNYMLRNMQ